jgi:hypothetical protein
MNEEKENSNGGFTDGFRDQRPYQSCSSCLDLDLNAVKHAVDKGEKGYSLIESDQIYGMNQPARHVRDAKNAGCLICALLWSVLVFFNANFRRDSINATVMLRFPINEENRSLEMSFCGASAHDICVQLFTSKYRL